MHYVELIIKCQVNVVSNYGCFLLVTMGVFRIVCARSVEQFFLVFLALYKLSCVALFHPKQNQCCIDIKV